MPAGSWTTAGIPICSTTSPVVAQRAGVYTVRDYASIIEHLVTAWNIAGRSVTGEAAQAQDELCRQAERYVRLAERTAAALAKQPRRRSAGFAIERHEPSMTHERIRLGISACLLGEPVRFDGGPQARSVPGGIARTVRRLGAGVPGGRVRDWTPRANRCGWCRPMAGFAC